MADIANLEKMGRELKCPICLSLLRSAASISCNHVFCNSCIVESMKSASSCPVCKVPFRRREIHAAPHMDNLVTIFKNMEAATGTNIVSTQLGSAPKDADGTTDANGGERLGTLQEPVVPQETKMKVASPRERIPIGRKRMALRHPPDKRSRKKKTLPKASAGSDSSPIAKPSFLKKKRIHVTPFPESETPIRPRKILKLEDPINQLSGDVEVDINKTSANDKPASPSLSPFFWLREGLGTADFDEELSGPVTLDTPLRHNAPTFSDIKDSDDEIPRNITPNSKDEAPGVFDSEIFEWTQRACSPELCSTPPKPQTTGRQALNQIPEKAGKGDQVNIGKSDKNRTSKKERRTKNNARLANQEITNNSEELTANSCRKNKGTTAKDPARRRLSKASGNRIQALHPEENSTKAMPPKEDGVEVQVSRHQLSQKAKKKEQNREGKRKRVGLGMAGEGTLETTKGSSALKRKQIRRSNDKDSNIHKELNNEMEHKCAELNHDRVIPNVSAIRCHTSDATGTTPLSKNAYEGLVQSGAVEAEYSGKFQQCFSGDGLLKKCENIISKVRCAFCQSNDITEDSGEMVHYLSGKEVPADFNGGTNVIHAHKNCMEWAPDVYFEDGSVFNLTAELARSKRIKCACCGIKGAALGCFETSCRKSFHFTCAKLIPECRWDNDNFVMLCPLHQSSKLPIEISQHQKQSKKRTIPKRPPYDCNHIWKWPSGSPRKWVLCCSALSAAQKGIVSEFARLAGVSVSTSWNSSVTHVIASIDQSGACKRTLKFLMAILNGKWIVSMDWVRICMESKEPVDEQRFEVTVDIHGIRDGPRMGRLRVMNKQPKLFQGMTLYFHGDYTRSYKGYLQDLVIAAGGTVLQRKPVSRDQQKLLDDSTPIFIVYCLENQHKEQSKGDASTDGRRRADAQALASVSGGVVVSSAWVIDSIAACKLQPF